MLSLFNLTCLWKNFSKVTAYSAKAIKDENLKEFVGVYLSEATAITTLWFNNNLNLEMWLYKLIWIDNLQGMLFWVLSEVDETN